VALKKVIPSVVKREDIFITSKLWNSSHQPHLVEKELDLTLKQLGLDYLDLYLVHWPIAFAPGNRLVPVGPDGWAELDLETSLVDTWKAMIALPKSKVRAIGVSNFSIEAVEGIIKATGVVPAVNQVEAHPLLLQDDLVNYSKEKGIHLTAYSPLGYNLVGIPKLTDWPEVVKIAEKYGATPAQILLAWGTKRGYSTIPKSVNDERIAINFKEVEISDEDYETLTTLGRERPTRYNIPFRFTPPVNISLFGTDAERNAKYHVKIA